MVSVLLIAILVVFGGLVISAAVVVAITRNQRLPLFLSPTCLLCGSSNATPTGGPNYVCRDCGFDTTKSATLTDELEAYRQFGAAVDGLEWDRNPGEVLQLLDDISARDPSVLDMPVTKESSVRTIRRELALVTNERLEESMETWRSVQLALRRHVLERMSTDGDVGGTYSNRLDFEHVVENDYYDAARLADESDSD